MSSKSLLLAPMTVILLLEVLMVGARFRVRPGHEGQAHYGPQVKFRDIEQRAASNNLRHFRTVGNNDWMFGERYNNPYLTRLQGRTGMEFTG